MQTLFNPAVKGRSVNLPPHGLAAHFNDEGYCVTALDEDTIRESVQVPGYSEATLPEGSRLLPDIPANVALTYGLAVASLAATVAEVKATDAELGEALNLALAAQPGGVPFVAAYELLDAVAISLREVANNRDADGGDAAPATDAETPDDPALALVAKLRAEKEKAASGEGSPVTLPAKPEGLDGLVKDVADAVKAAEEKAAKKADADAKKKAAAAAKAAAKSAGTGGAEPEKSPDAGEGSPAVNSAERNPEGSPDA